jgi:hypothetical protein
MVSFLGQTVDRPAEAQGSVGMYGDFSYRDLAAQAFFLSTAGTDGTVFAVRLGVYGLDSTSSEVGHYLVRPSPIPEPIECIDGLDNDADGYIDWNGGPLGEPADPGCTDADDLSERSPLLVCDEGVDNDGDGGIDFDPVTHADPGDQYTPPSGFGDPGCFNPSYFTENPQCQDGYNNDPAQDALIDFDGGASAGVPPEWQTDPDPQCTNPWQNRESSCGLGVELALLMPPLMWMWRRRRSHH